MRLVGEGTKGKQVGDAPLRITGRMTQASGYDELLYPNEKNLHYHQKIMKDYFTNLDDIKLELGNILKKDGGKEHRHRVNRKQRPIGIVDEPRMFLAFAGV